MDDGWMVNYLSLWMSFMFLYILCIPHVVSLHIATLAQSTLSAIAAGDVSQLRQQKLRMFLCCVVLHKS